MDPRYSAEAEAYRQKIQAFLAEHLPADWAGVGALGADERTRFVAEWRQTLADNDLLAVAWPKDYGGGRAVRHRAGRPQRGVHPGRRAHRRRPTTASASA